MEKIIEVGDYRIPAKSTAASLIAYKANFKRDAMRDLMALSKAIPKNGDFSRVAEVEGFDFDIFSRFLWVFAKAANPTIPPLVEWLDSIEVPPLEFVAVVYPQIQELLISTVGTTVKAKK